MALVNIRLPHAEIGGHLSQSRICRGAFPVDWKTRGPSDILTLQSRFLDGILLTDIAVREWIGLIAYRMVGKTDELFPSPRGAAK